MFKKSDVEDIFKLFKNSNNFGGFLEEFKSLKAINSGKGFDDNALDVFDKVIPKINDLKETKGLFDKKGNNTKQFDTLLDSIKSLGDEEITNAFKDFANKTEQAYTYSTGIFEILKALGNVDTLDAYLNPPVIEPDDEASDGTDNPDDTNADNGENTEPTNPATPTEPDNDDTGNDNTDTGGDTNGG